MNESTSRSGSGDISGAIRRAFKRKRSEGAEAASHPTARDTETTPQASDREAVKPLIVGESVTTFGNEPWWTNKNWNRLPSSGGVNGLRVHNGVFGNLAVCGGSLRGRRHQLAGQPNDDSFDITTVSDTSNNPAWLVVAVCDGVGSAAFSNAGAASTSAHATALVAHSLRSRPSVAPEEYANAFAAQSSQFLELLTTAVRGDIQRPQAGWTRQLEFTPPADVATEELQTTLTVCVLRATPDTSGRYVGVVITIGDSPALRLSTSLITRLEADNDASDIWSTATSGVLGAHTASVTPFDIDHESALMVATDGIANFLTHNGSPTPLGNYMLTNWLTPVDTISFARDLNFDLASADDDRTAVMVWPRHE